MSYYRQGPFRPPGGMQIGFPPVTPWIKRIMIACGAVWLLQVLVFNVKQPPKYDLLAQWFGAIPQDIFQGQLWQLVTYAFLHAPTDIMHILFNMLMLWMFGGDLERHWGGRAFLRYYTVCAIGGGVFIAVIGYFTGGLAAATPTIGASGAVFGLIAAFGLIFAERPVIFMLLFPMKARTMAMILFAITCFYTFSGTGGNVSHVGHLGGAVVGFLYLKRAWRIDLLWGEVQWRLKRRRFKVMHQNDRNDSDRWMN